MSQQERKQRLRELCSSPRFSYFVLFCVLVVLHLQLTLGTGDDIANKTMLENYDLLVRLKESYQTWSSRQLVDAVMYIMCALPYLVWRLVNPLVITLGVFCATRLLQLEKDARAVRFICGLVLCYQWAVLVSAGWISTTVTYVWPLVAALVALQPFVNVVRGNPMPWWCAVLSLPVLLYAGNMEQVLVVVTICLVVSDAFLMFYKRQRPWLLQLQIYVCFANFLYVLTCPGAMFRVESESAAWFKDFGMRSIWQKIELGLSNGFSHLMYEKHYLFFLLCFMLVLCVWSQYKSKVYRAIACFPLVVVTTLGLFGAQLRQIVPALSFFPNALTPTGMLTVENAAIPKRYLSFLLLCFAFCATLVSIYLALGHTVDAVVGLVLLCAGFSSYAMMGFTPSIWVSGTRTAFFVSLSILGCCMLLYRMHFTNGKNTIAWRILQVVVGVCMIAQCTTLIGA